MSIGSEDEDINDFIKIDVQNKEKCMRYSAKMIKNGDTIFLDASTSSLHLARSIKDKKSITVITNAEKIVVELANCPDIKVISTGGMLHQKNMSYIGRIVEETIRKNYYANKVFFSCLGITLSRGLMEATETEAEIKKAMIDCSESAVLLCDRKKLGRIGVPIICQLDKIDCLITDIKLDEEWNSVLQKNDVSNSINRNC